MNTFYLSKCWLVLVAISITTLSATSGAIALGEAASGNALLKGAPASATLSSASYPLALNITADRTLDEYQPPDNGGPGKTGGSGTR